MSDSIHKPDSEYKAPGPVRRREKSASSKPGPLVTNRSGPQEPFPGIPGFTGQSGSDFVDIDLLPRDVGWLLFGVGFAGVVAPGIFGLPFMVGGGMILWPKACQGLIELLGGDSTKTMNAGARQIHRFLSDLEKRYPYK